MPSSSLSRPRPKRGKKQRGGDGHDPTVLQEHLCKVFSTIPNRGTGMNLSCDDTQDRNRRFLAIVRAAHREPNSVAQIIPRIAAHVEKLYKDKKYSYASWHWDSYSVKAAWSMMLGAKLVNVRQAKPNGELMGDSANCRFTTLHTLMRRDSVVDVPESLFVKVVTLPVPRNNDHILVDNINGWIFNEISSKERLHAMTYVDSFLSFFTDYNGNSWEFAKLMDVSNSGCKFYLPNDNANNANAAAEAQSRIQGGLMAPLPKCYISISNALMGKSLRDHLEAAMDALAQQNVSMAAPALKTCKDIISASVDFYTNFVKKYGLENGMLHNDLHLGNMFYLRDVHASRIVMIDYGRVYFAQPPVDTERLDKFVKREAVKLGLKDESDKVTYQSVMKEFHQHMKSNVDVDVWRLMHIADLMTFAGNMYVFLLIAYRGDPELLKQVKDIIDKFIKFETYGTGTEEQKLYRRNIQLTVPSNISDILDGYEELVTKINNNGPFRVLINNNGPSGDFLKIIGEGLFYIACLIYNMYAHYQTLNGLIEVRLKDVDYLWHHFQYTGPAGYMVKFVGWLKNWKYLQTVCPVFGGNLNVGVGGRRKKNTNNTSGKKKMKGGNDDDVFGVDENDEAAEISNENVKVQKVTVDSRVNDKEYEGLLNAFVKSQEMKEGRRCGNHNSDEKYEFKQVPRIEGKMTQKPPHNVQNSNDDFTPQPVGPNGPKSLPYSDKGLQDPRSVVNSPFNGGRALKKRVVKRVAPKNRKR